MKRNSTYSYEETKTVNYNGQTAIFICKSSRRANCERVCTTVNAGGLVYSYTDSLYTWENRPWQSFDFETAIKRAISKIEKDFPGLASACTVELIDRKERQIENDMKEFDDKMKVFSKTVETLTDRQKGLLSESIEKGASPATVHGVACLMSVLNSCK